MRGKTVEDGATRVAANGYHYTKQNGKWRLTHHITAERKLGRPLKESERVHFTEPKGKRDPYDERYIKVVVQGTSSTRKRKAQIEARLDELIAELNGLHDELGIPHMKLIEAKG
jgi:hypothetical protein